MARKIKEEEKGGGLPLWIGTFGDLMSLLLTFFILILSMANFDGKKLQEAEASVRGALSILEGGIKFDPSENRITLPADIVPPPEYTDEVRLIEQSIIDFHENPKVSHGAANVVGDGMNGFIITLPANIFFDSDFRLNQDSKIFLHRIAQIFARMPQNVVLEVLGRSNLGNAQVNLERASSIALAISRELLAQNVAPNRINTLGREDKSVEFDTINIRFYAKNITQSVQGILDFGAER